MIRKYMACILNKNTTDYNTYLCGNSPNDSDGTPILF